MISFLLRIKLAMQYIYSSNYLTPGVRDTIWQHTFWCTVGKSWNDRERLVQIMQNRQPGPGGPGNQKNKCYD